MVLHALLASLYSKVNFLKNEIENKSFNPTLIIKHHEVCDDNNSNLIPSTSEYITTSEHDKNSNYDDDTILGDPAKATNLPANYEVVDDSYQDQQNDIIRSENEINITRQRNLDNQLIHIRSLKHDEFIRMVVMIVI